MRTPGMRRIGFALLVATALTSPATAGLSSWTISEATSGVVVVHDGQTKVGRRGARVEPGDMILTGINDRAVIVREQRFAIIAPQSRLQVLDPTVAAAAPDLFEKAGSVVYTIEKMLRPHFAVRTEYAAAVVKGTTFSVSVDENGASVQVVEGSVEVTTADGGVRELIKPGAVATVEAAHPENLIVRDGSTTTLTPQGAIEANALSANTGEATSPIATSITSNDVMLAAVEEPSYSISKLSAGLVAGNSTVDAAVVVTSRLTSSNSASAKPSTSTPVPGTSANNATVPASSSTASAVSVPVAVVTSSIPLPPVSTDAAVSLTLATTMPAPTAIASTTATPIAATPVLETSAPVTSVPVTLTPVAATPAPAAIASTTTTPFVATPVPETSAPVTSVPVTSTSTPVPTIVVVPTPPTGFSLGAFDGFGLLLNNGVKGGDINTAPVNANIGVGNITASVNLHNEVVNGIVDTSGALSTVAGANITGTVPADRGGGTATVNQNQSTVQSAISAANTLSQTYAAEAAIGKPVTLSGNVALYASTGYRDTTGTVLFTATTLTIGNGNALTINGTSAQYVVINVTSGSGNKLDGAVTLTGGITPDHVLINFTGSGGSLQGAANGAAVNATILAPSLGIQLNSVTINGHVFGGATGTDFQFAGNALINQPADSAASTSTNSAALRVMRVSIGGKNLTTTSTRASSGVRRNEKHAYEHKLAALRTAGRELSEERRHRSQVMDRNIDNGSKFAVGGRARAIP